jgi:dihydrofolate synthase / folylpolyglutamate synthase
VKAEEWLASLDPIGWRFGLDRIKAILAALGDPQLEFESIHVVGTNGKSSVTQMTAALIELSGRTTGEYLSPHSERWAERVRIRGAEIEADAFDRAVGAVADAVPGVERRFEEGDRVTQFEAATAAAFVALRDAGVEVGVIEAGLGGRLDATNVLDSRVTVLTSIGLDHTQWLGDSELEIAGEKLAVLRPGSTLVTGDLSPAVAELARTVANERACRQISARTSHSETYRGSIGTFAADVPYLRRNLAVAIAAAEAFLGGPLGDDAVARGLESLELPGRFDLIDGDPPVIRDAAHNPDGATALAEALQTELGERPVIACLAVLSDKDAAGIVQALAQAITSAVVTEIPAERLEGAGRPGTTSVSAAMLAGLCEDSGVPASVELDPVAAIATVLERAKAQDGVALVAGSHYLLSY